MSTSAPDSETVNGQPCPVARSVDLIGDRWSLLIVRDAFDGMRRFSDFQRSLGVARNILSDRLKKLVDAGILQTEAAAKGSAYQAYVLTPRGESLFPVVLALRQWGEGLRHFCAEWAAAGKINLQYNHGLLSIRITDGNSISAFAAVFLSSARNEHDFFSFEASTA